MCDKQNNNITKGYITMNNTIKIVSQAFYGNRTRTEINKEDVDRFILGYIDDSIAITEEINRTIIGVPNTDNIVIVYNKYKEDEATSRKEGRNPLVVIPENNIKLYSRCIVCRLDENGKFESLQSGDYKKFMKYLSE